MEPLTPTTLSPDVYRVASNASATRGAEEQELGRNEFLKLLVAQLESQDPLNPQADSEFIAQLATFSSLEQLTDLNTRMDSVIAGQSQLAMLQTQTLDNQAMELIGREILISTDGRVVVEESGPETLVYDLPEAVAGARFEVLGEDGETVIASVELDGIAAGRHEIEWDGLGASGEPLPPGSYQFRIETIAESGESNSVAGFAKVIASGIHVGPEGLHLVAPGRAITAADIVEIGTRSG